MHVLWNDTDGIPAWPEPFETEGAALAFAREFRAGYARQGYYLMADGRRIDPEEVVLTVRQADG